MYTRHDTNRTILSRLAGGVNWAVAGVRSDSGSSFISRPIIVTSRRQQGLSRRCTTMSTAESTPPEVFKWTGGIISTLVEPRVSWRTRGGRRLARRSAETSGGVLSAVQYDTICYFNVLSKAGISQLNLPHGTKPKKVEEKKN